MLKMIKSNKIWISTAVLIMLAAFGGYKYYEANKPAEVAVRTANVEYGNLQDTISATGSLSAVDNVDISSKITGRIVEVLVKENQHVEAGQVLVKLDDKSLAATAMQMKARLDNAFLTYKRYEKLLNQGAVSQSTFDTAYADYIVAKANHDQAVSNVNDTVITSPISGYIIGEPTPVGQTISSGISTPQVIMSVANLDNMQIETLVDESDIGRVREGQKVEFTVDAYPDETFVGWVRLVSRAAVTENNVIYYTVYVDVEKNEDGKLLPTMTARANIVVKEEADVIMVPINCVYSDGERRFVKVYDLKNKTEKQVDVKLGMLGEEKVAVSGDLQAGDKLVVKLNKAKQQNNMRPPM